MATNKLKMGKTPSRKALYNNAAKYAREAIEVLVNEMRNGDNSNARTGAAKALLNKCIPDLKAMEMSGDNVTPIIIKLDGTPRISTETTRGVGSAEEREL